MIARINRTALLALLALILGITAVTYAGCCSTDDDDSAADDDDSATDDDDSATDDDDSSTDDDDSAIDDDDSAEQIVLTTVALALIFLYVLELRRQLNEVSEAMTRIHQDFLTEANTKYGETLDGEK